MSNCKHKFDIWLLFSVISLLSLGFVMVTSSSLPIAERFQMPVYYYALNQLIYISIGVLSLIIVSFIPIKVLHSMHGVFLVFSLCMLGLLLVPGVTRPINGSLRWIFVGSFSIQPSEIIKLALVIYMASYIVRRNYQIKNKLTGFVIPMFILGVIALLLLFEPDFGSVVVLAITVLGMLFLGGVQTSRFLVLIPGLLCTLAFFSVSSSYRVQRFTSFWDPWADQFDSGYQLVQSLIAFGRGGWFGTGLGSSVQKLLYLPEAHTDFVFAVIAEELGIFGALLVIVLLALLVFRAMEVGRRAQQLGNDFAGNLAYGISLLIGSQALINIGVNTGVLPTKGLTLPLISAGGSSMIMVCVAIGILFRIDFESYNVNQVNQTS